MRIGIAGHAGAGKSTASGLLAARINAAGFVVAIDAFAVDLKRDVRRFYGWDGIDKSDQCRKLLQTVGQNMRLVNPDTWVSRCAIRESSGIRSADVVIYSDVRYANEASFVRKDGALVWVVDRMAHLSPEAAGHPSEAFDFDHAESDLTIRNSGTIIQFMSEINAVADGIIADLIAKERKCLQ